MANHHEKLGAEMLDFLNDNNQLPVLTGDNYYQKIVNAVKDFQTKTDSDFRVQWQLLDRAKSLEKDKKSMPPGYAGYNEIVNLTKINNFLEGYRESIKERENAQKNDNRLGGKDKEIVNFRQELIDFLNETESDALFTTKYDDTPTSDLVNMAMSARHKTGGKRDVETRKSDYRFQAKKSNFLEKAQRLGVRSTSNNDSGSGSKPKIRRDMRERKNETTQQDENSQLEKPRRDLRHRKSQGARFNP